MSPDAPPPPPPPQAESPAAPAFAIAAGSTKLQQRIEAFLGGPVDAGFAGFAGHNPIVLVVSRIVLLVSTAALVTAILVEASVSIRRALAVVLIASLVAMLVTVRRSPVRWVAIRGDEVTLIATARVANETPRPTQVAFSGPIDSVTGVPGSRSALQIGPERVWFRGGNRRFVSALTAVAS
jgi:hypothetical protein